MRDAIAKHPSEVDQAGQLQSNDSIEMLESTDPGQVNIYSETHRPYMRATYTALGSLQGQSFAYVDHDSGQTNKQRPGSRKGCATCHCGAYDTMAGLHSESRCRSRRRPVFTSSDSAGQAIGDMIFVVFGEIAAVKLVSSIRSRPVRSFCQHENDLLSI